MAPLLGRQSILGAAARVGLFHSLSSSPATRDNVQAAAVPVRAVQEALAEFDFLVTPSRHASAVQEDQTMAVLSPVGWPSSALIEDGTSLSTQLNVILVGQKVYVSESV
jgi:hypothetical protein